MRSRQSLTAFIFALGLAACSGDDGGTQASDTGLRGSTANVCSGAGKGIAVGVTQQGEAGVFSFELVAANPAPPEQFDNAWTVAVTNGAGDPAPDVVLLVGTWMPDHGHSSPKAVNVTQTADGSFELDPVNLFMPGLWEITMTAEAADGTSDETVFSFCLNGEFPIGGGES